MLQVIAAWGLDSQAVTDELILIASTDRRLVDRMRMRPSKLTETAPLLSRARTPAIHDIFRGMLFVVISHNLLIESYVSRMKRLERAHPNLHVLTLGHMFKYKVRQERVRQERLCLRSDSRGALRQAALAAVEAGARACGTANDSKCKLRALVGQLECDVTRYIAANIRRRGAGSLRTRLCALRAAHDTRQQAVAAAVNDSLRRTCARTGTGRERSIWAAAECRLLLGVDAAPLFGGAKVKKHKGNIFKDADVLRRAKVRASCSLSLSHSLLTMHVCVSHRRQHAQRSSRHRSS